MNIVSMKTYDTAKQRSNSTGRCSLKMQVARFFASAKRQSLCRAVIDRATTPQEPCLPPLIVNVKLRQSDHACETATISAVSDTRVPVEFRTTCVPESSRAIRTAKSRSFIHASAHDFFMRREVFWWPIYRDCRWLRLLRLGFQ